MENKKTLNTDQKRTPANEAEPDESTPLMEGHVGAPQISCNNSLTGGAERKRQQKRKVEQLNSYGGTEQRDATDGVGVKEINL